MQQIRSLEDIRLLLADAETIDAGHFAEQRENILFVAGKHYVLDDYDNLMDPVVGDNDFYAINNHIGRIAEIKTMQIMQAVPNIQVLPQNPKQIQDQKSAELFNSVWQYIYKTENLKNTFHLLSKDFIELGECVCLIKWNTNKNQELVDYNSPNSPIHIEGKEGSDLNYPSLNTALQPLNKVSPQQGKWPQDKPNSIFLGGFDFQRVFPTNLLRPSQNTTIESCPWLAITSLVPPEWIKDTFNIDITDNYLSSYGNIEHQFFVFQEDSLIPYSLSANKARLNEMFFRPCPWLPYGRYIMTCGDYLLQDTELPFGIFPIVYAGYRNSQTSARSYSILNDLKPFQRQINRCITESIRHQMSIGSDKLLLDSEASVSDSSIIPGIQSIKYNSRMGEKPTILAGRAGDQFMGTLTNQINQMYAVANIKYELVESGIQRASQSIKDPYNALFEQMNERQDNVIYNDKMEKMITDIAKTTLKLARYYLSDEHVIPMIGRNERVNIAEFRLKNDIDQRICLLPRSDDAVSVMGKQLALMQTLQYAANVLPMESIGNIIENMPFFNKEQISAPLTQDYENSVNMILALDRGEPWQADQQDNTPNMISQLTMRMRQSDFKFLEPQKQRNYVVTLQQYQQIMQQKQEEIKRQQMQEIPTHGAYVRTGAKYPQKTKSGNTVMKDLYMPQSTIEWMVEFLKKTKGWTPEGASNQQAQTVAGAIPIMQKLSQQGIQPPMQRSA